MAQPMMDHPATRSRLVRPLGMVGIWWMAILLMVAAPASANAQDRDLEWVVLESATRLLFERDMVPSEGGHVALRLRDDNLTSLPYVAALLGRSVEQMLADHYDHSLQATSTLEKTAGIAFEGLPETRQVGTIRFTRSSLSELGGLRRSGSRDGQVEGVDAAVYFFPDAWILESGTVLVELMLSTARGAFEGRSRFEKVHMLLDQGTDGGWSVRDYSIIGRGS